jgi:hypothetical protein
MDGPMPNTRTTISLLFCAAILNYLVALVCMLWSPYTHNDSPPEKPDGSLPADVRGPDGSMNWWLTHSGPGVYSASPAIAEVYQETIFNGWKFTATPAFFRSGWPMLSMQSIVHYYQAPDGHDLARWELPKTEILSRGLQINQLPAFLHAQPDRRIPLIPIPIGFTVNTACYFLVLLVIHRLWRRFHPGHCVHPHLGTPTAPPWGLPKHNEESKLTPAPIPTLNPAAASEYYPAHS